MRTLVLSAVVGVFGIAVFAGGIWLGVPGGAYMPLSDELAAQCQTMGGCTVVPVAFIRYAKQRMEQCRGNDKDRT